MGRREFYLWNFWEKDVSHLLICEYVTGLNW